MIRFAVRPALAARLGPWLAVGVAGRAARVDAVEVPPADGRDLLAGGAHTVVATALLAGRLRALAATSQSDARLVAVEGAGVFAVAADGASVRQLTFEPASAGGAAAVAELEAALGPALVLALAGQGILCLHATAATTGGGGGAFVFLGDSGAGKSTLAAAGGERLTDDVTPVVPGMPPRILPDFPQLKLDPAAAARPPRPLRALVVLAPPPPAGTPETGDEVRLEAVPPAAAAAALVAHTVASRLLAPDALAAHLSACAALASEVPVRRLVYPRRRDLLPAVWRALDGLPA